MGLPSGLAGQWCAVDETTYGVAPTLTGAPFTIFDSDSIKLKKTTKEGAGIYAGALVAKSARRVLTEYMVQGAAPADLPAQGLNKWLYRMFGSFGQSNAVLTEDMSTAAYKAVHVPGDLTGHTFALQAGRPDISGTVAPFTYTGMKVSEWEISAAMGEIPKWTLTFEGRNELAGSGNGDPLNGSVPSLLTYSAPVGGVFKWNQGTVFYGGTPSTTSGITTLASPTAAGNIKSFSVKMTRPMDTNRFSPELAGWRNEPLQNALLKITAQFEVEWLSTNAYYNAYANDTATAFSLAFTGPVIGTGSDHSSLGLLMSNIRLEGDSPSVSGPAVLTQTIPVTVYDDGTNSTLQATYWTLDTT
jgi:hypothetical protein